MSASFPIDSTGIGPLNIIQHVRQNSLPRIPPLLHSSSWKEKSSKQRTWGSPYGPLSPAHSHPKASGFALIRPCIALAALIAVVFTFSTFISGFVFGSTANLLERIPFRSSTSVQPPPCDPYSSSGTLSVDHNDPDANRWIPKDPACKSPAFFSLLRSENTPASSFSWLANRTALIIGDSVSREHVENFCVLMGVESEVMKSGHKWSVAGMKVSDGVKAGQTMDRPTRLAQRGLKSMKESSLPRLCYISQYDFLLVSVFHFGLDQEDYWRDSNMPQYSSPGLFENRLTDIISPIISNLRADGRRSAPDLVEVSSGSWDLARWAKQDIAEGKPTDVAVDPERLIWYRFRVGQMLEKIRLAFPDAKSRTWRTMHYPKDQAMEEDYFMDKISRSSAPPTASPSFAYKRIDQLEQAVRSLIVPTQQGDLTVAAPHSEFRINRWGSILKGQEAHQRDRMHGDPLPGGYVWGDMLLAEMHRGVMESEAKSRRAITSPRRS